MKYKCKNCGYVYDENVKEIEFSKLSSDYKCPFCESSVEAFEIYEDSVKKYDKVIKIEASNPSLSFIPEKCTNCGMCKRVCENIVGIKYDDNKVKRPVCINCGQCIINCPTSSLVTKYDYLKVIEYLKKKDTIVTISVAPAIRVSIGDEFDMPAGSILTQKLVGALKKCGFDYVFDLTYGADLTIMEEAMELVERINKKEHLPLFTSCCPSWVKYCEIYHEELLGNLSSTKSPIMMQGSIINNFFFRNKNNKKIINVMLAPCTAKKLEIKTNDFKDIDLVITTRELKYILNELNIDFNDCDKCSFDNIMSEGSGAGTIFGTSGGVLQAALRTLYFYLTGKHAPSDFLLLEPLCTFENTKVANITINDQVYKVASVYGMPALEKLLEHKDEYLMIEVMNCPNGCVGGGGQSLINLAHLKETREKRGLSLYDIDKNQNLRNSYENPDILRLYSEFLKYPGSDVAKKYLHTSFNGLHDKFFKKENN